MQNKPTDLNDKSVSLREHQRNVSAIYRQRKRILQEINQKSKQKKFLNSSEELPKLKEIKSQTQIHDNLRKIVKTQSISNISLQDGHEGKNQSKIDQTLQTKKAEKVSHVPQAIADRNRRMFGGLTTHLRKAGQLLQSKESKQKQQNAKQILNKFISKQKQQRQELQNKKKQQLQIQLNKLQQQKKQNEDKMNKAENQMLSFIVKSHFNAIGNFYLTRTEPKLFWKPKKDFEDLEKAQKIKQYGQKYLKKQEEECLQKVVSYNEVFDHGKYMTQNQRQFYTSFINNIHRDHKNFILTKTEPCIFWKPIKNFKDLQALLQDTSLRLDENSTSLNKINLEYYKARQTNIIDQHNKQFFDAQNQEEQEKAE